MFSTIVLEILIVFTKRSYLDLGKKICVYYSAGNQLVEKRIGYYENDRIGQGHPVLL